MSVRNKIFATILIFAALIAITGFVGLHSLQQYKEKNSKLTQSVLKVNDIQNLRVDSQSLYGLSHAYFRTKQEDRFDAFSAKLRDLNSKAKDVADSTVCMDCQKTLFEASDALEGINLSVVELKSIVAKGDQAVILKAENELKAKIDDISAKLAESTEMTIEQAKQLNEESEQAYRTYTLFIPFTSFLVIILGISLGYLLTRGISSAISELSDATQDFTQGNRDKRIRAKLPSEFSTLAGAFNQMAGVIQTSEQSMEMLNESLVKEVDRHKGKLELAGKETNQRVQEIKAYLEIVKTLNSTLSLNQMLERTSNTLANVFKADYAAIALINENTLSHCWEVENCDKSDCPAYKSTNLECWTLNRTICRNSIQGSFEEKIEECVNCQVFKNIKIKVSAMSGVNKEVFIDLSKREFSSKEATCGHTLLTLKPSIEKLKESSDLMSIKKLDPGCKLQISIPLTTKDRVLGVVNLTYKSEREFASRETELIASLCDQIAIGIENARLFEQAKKSATEFSMLYRAGKTLGSLPQQEEILKHALDNAVKTFGADAGAVLLYDSKREKLKAVALRNINRGLLQLIGKKKDEGIAGLVIAAGKPLLVDDRYDKQENYKLDKIRSSILTPLKYDEQLFGVICLVSLTGRYYNYSDLRLLSTIGDQAATAMHNKYLFNQLEDLYFDTVSAFTKAIEAKDSYTKGHSENVAVYSVAIARKLGLSSDAIKMLKTAALLHDIGKIGIKEEVLNKPGQLNDEEFDHIKQHPLISFKIIEHVPTLRDIANIILHHHEKFDGSGYLNNLKDQEIPLESRILAVADAFDAMTSSRPYRKASSLLSAREELIKNSGKQFDPEIVEIFVELLDKNEIPLIGNETSEDWFDDISEDDDMAV